jgi:hypothetical protein
MKAMKIRVLEKVFCLQKRFKGWLVETAIRELVEIAPYCQSS